MGVYGAKEGKGGRRTLVGALKVLLRLKRDGVWTKMVFSRMVTEISERDEGRRRKRRLSIGREVEGQIGSLTGLLRRDPARDWE